MSKLEKKKKIIFCGGGTLGHILPFIPIVMNIYNKYDVYFIGTIKGMERKYFNENDLNKYFKQQFYLDMDGISRKNMFRNIKVIYKYFCINKQIREIYNKIKPNLIIGMGGYISGVCINKALKMNIKTFIHEQNAVMGLANKLIYKKVNKLLLSYDIKYIKTNNAIVIGNPRYSYVKENYIPKDKNIILIISGSLGSKCINDLIINNIDYLKYDNYLIKLVTGKKYYNEHEYKINKINNDYNNIIIYPFLNNLLNEMKNSSLIISRSGATTISEIIGLSKPSILIPSPNVTNNHQYLNAKILEESNSCILVEEKNLNIEILDKYIRQIITNYGYKKQMMTNLKKLYKNDPLSDFIKLIEEEI